MRRSSRISGMSRSAHSRHNQAAEALRATTAVSRTAVGGAQRIIERAVGVIPRAPAKSRSAPNARTCLSLESGSRPGPTRSRGAGPRRGLIRQMGDESRRCRGPSSDPACAAQTGHCRLPASTQLNGDIPERWIQAESPTEEGRGYPGVMVPGQEWRRAGLLDPAPATERDQTKLYGFVVNSWSDKVLSVQRIWTRTRTR